MRAVFLDYATVSYGDLQLERLRQVLPDLTVHDVTREPDIAGRIAGRAIVMVNKLRIGRALMQGNPDLKLIVLSATGTDNIELAAARELGIGVCNVRNYCTTSLAQHVLAMILALTHRVREYARIAVDGTWAASEQFTRLDYSIRELRGRTLGIVGHGTLGGAVAQIAQAALGMRILIAQRPGVPATAERVPLPELLASADVVSLHCPLTPETQNLIGARELSLMKPDALLINTARGGLVDGAALAAALRERRIGGAAIDVLPKEPPVDGHPLLDPTIPNLIVTPHIAWAAREARQRCLDEMALNIEDFLRGGARNRVV